MTEAIRPIKTRQWRFAYFGLILTPLLLGAAPAKAKGNPWQGVGVAAAGPIVLLLSLAAVAVVYLILASFRKQDGLMALVQSAGPVASQGKFLNTLWGIFAEILLLAAGSIVAKLPHAGLLVVLIFLSAFVLAGLGLCVSAEVAGRRLHSELAGGEVSPLKAVGIGLQVFTFAAAVPVLGWIVVILLATNGVGSILSATTSRQPE
jgi:hypothetical protein